PLEPGRREKAPDGLAPFTSAAAGLGRGALTARPSRLDPRHAMWLEIELDVAGADVRVSARGSRGERPAQRTLAAEQGTDALQTFSNKVGRAVRSGRQLDPAIVADAQALHAELFKGELRDLVVRLTEASKAEPLLMRLFLRDRLLQSVPWEA